MRHLEDPVRATKIFVAPYLIFVILLLALLGCVLPKYRKSPHRRGFLILVEMLGIAPRCTQVLKMLLHSVVCSFALERFNIYSLKQTRQIDI